jgi:cytochrome c-type biogenesis protein CcmH/NrfG
MSADTHLLLATMYQKAGRAGEAARTLEALLEQDPANRRARRMLEAIRSDAPRPQGPRG